MLWHSCISTIFPNTECVPMVRFCFIKELIGINEALLHNHDLEHCQLKQLSTCAAPSGIQLKLSKIKSHHESETIPKDDFHYLAPQTVLAGAQPEGAAQMKMASTAWKQNAKQLSDNTETVYLYENL